MVVFSLTRTINWEWYSLRAFMPITLKLHSCINSHKDYHPVVSGVFVLEERNIKLLILGMAFSLLSGITGLYVYGKKPHLVIEAQLLFLNLDEPIKDAKRAISKGDYRCYMVQGYAAYFPGLEHHDYNKCDYKTGIMIHGTSDYMFGAEHVDAINKSIDYSSQYNKYVVSQRKITLGSTSPSGGSDY